MISQTGLFMIICVSQVCNMNMLLMEGVDWLLCSEYKQPVTSLLSDSLVWVTGGGNIL